VGIVIGTLLFINCFRKSEVWKLIFTSLICQMLNAVFQYCNIRRYNIKWGIPDFEYNLVLNLTGKAALISLSILPMTILMMYVVPKNIEASMFSIITAILTLSTYWAGDMMGAFYCDLFGVTAKNLTNFHKIIIVKICLVTLCIGLT